MAVGGQTGHRRGSNAGTGSKVSERKRTFGFRIKGSANCGPRIHQAETEPDKDGVFRRGLGFFDRGNRPSWVEQVSQIDASGRPVKLFGPGLMTLPQ